MQLTYLFYTPIKKGKINQPATLPGYSHQTWGNGRAGRLLEKWFIAEKLGAKPWYLQSELHYYTHVADYYRNLNRLGIFYEQLDYGKAMPFLMMLPEALVERNE